MSRVQDFTDRYFVLNWWSKYRAVCVFQLLEGGSTNLRMETARSGRKRTNTWMRQRNKPSSSKYKAECDKHQDTAAEQQSLIEEMHFPHDDEENERNGEELPTFTSTKDEECDQHDGAAEQQPFIEEMRFFT